MTRERRAVGSWGTRPTGGTLAAARAAPFNVSPTLTKHIQQGAQFSRQLLLQQRVAARRGPRALHRGGGCSLVGRRVRRLDCALLFGGQAGRRGRRRLRRRDARSRQEGSTTAACRCGSGGGGEAVGWGPEQLVGRRAGPAGGRRRQPGAGVAHRGLAACNPPFFGTEAGALRVGVRAGEAAAGPPWGERWEGEAAAPAPRAVRARLGAQSVAG